MMRRIGEVRSESPSSQHQSPSKPIKGEEPLLATPTNSDARENTPLIASKPGGTGFTIPFSATDLKATAAQSLSRIAEQAIKAKNSMKQSPWLVSLVIGIASLGVLAAGFFGLVTNIFWLHPVTAVIKFYQMIFASLCLIVEGARYYNFFNIKAKLRRFFPVFELTLGRGLLYILTSGLALAGDWTVGEAFPGMVLALCGIFNMLWGIKTALHVKSLFDKLKSQIQEENGKEGGTGILLIQKRFAALDLNGDGKLSKEELDIGCKAFNIDLDESELDMVFNLLDPKKKGFVGIDDFEEWWYAEKDVTRYLH